MGRSASSEGGWITTFADLMTLLFCFFVLLNALSTQGVAGALDGNDQGGSALFKT